MLGKLSFEVGAECGRGPDLYLLQEQNTHAELLVDLASTKILLVASYPVVFIE